MFTETRFNAIELVSHRLNRLVGSDDSAATKNFRSIIFSAHGFIWMVLQRNGMKC